MKEMTVEKLKELCEKAIADGYGDAIVEVQAFRDGIKWARKHPEVEK